MNDVFPLGIQGNRLPWQTVVAHSQAFTQQKLYGLVDGAMEEHFLGVLRDHCPTQAWCSLYAALPEGSHPEVSPLLLPLALADDAGERMFNRLIYYQKRNPESLVFLWSQSPLEELATHLGRYAEIQTVEGKRALLRFHDPNIWPAALAVQTQEERAQFLSRICEAWFCDLDATWWRHRNAHPAEGLAVEPPAWDAARHARFTALTQPRKLLLRLEEDHAEQITGSRVAWLAAIAGWIEQAQRLKIVRADEQYVFCVAALYAGDRFYEAPAIAAALDQIGTRYTSFTEAIQSIPPEVWDDVGRHRYTEAHQ